MVAVSVVITSRATTATPVPISTASTASRLTRRGLESALARDGKKYMASISSSTLTTSTESWVRARSGAEKRTKISDTISPTTLRQIIAIIRWRCSTVVSRAAAISIKAQRTDTPSTGSMARSPVKLARLGNCHTSTAATSASTQAT